MSSQTKRLWESKAMISLEPFPAHVTHDTEQSRTLGAELDRILGGRCPQEVLDLRAGVSAVLHELWRNLPCIGIESLIHCLPFYIKFNSNPPERIDGAASLPEIWQVNEELAQRLAFACESKDVYQRVLARFGRVELEQVLDLCEKLEIDSGESLKCFRELVIGQLHIN
jgi:hypothetical protein